MNNEEPENQLSFSTKYIRIVLERTKLMTIKKREA